MGRAIYFIRKSPEDIIREQNKLIAKLIENQQNAPAPQVIVQTTTSTAAPVQEISQTEETDFSFDASDAVPFIPKVAKAKATLGSGVETSKSKFDADDVEKLSRAKQEAQKK